MYDLMVKTSDCVRVTRPGAWRPSAPAIGDLSCVAGMLY